MIDSYTQTLQDQIGQLSRLLGGLTTTLPTEPATPAASRYDCVDGLEGARSFQQKMLAGTRHIVWDSGQDVFYVLPKDANGNPARIQICPFTIQTEPTMDEKYVTKDDFNALVAKIDQLLN